MVRDQGSEIRKRSGEKRLGPGLFLQERAAIKHTTAATAESDLEFFEEGAGPFAVQMIK